MPSSQGSAGAEIARRLVPHLVVAALAVAGTRAPAAAAATPDGGSAEGPPRDAGASPTYETVISAPPTPEEQPREDQAASASTITADRTPRSSESVPQLLSELPGVSVNRFGGLGALATVSLRGSSSNQVLVEVDGVPINTATGGGVDLGAIPLGNVERIEVYRGTSPLGFGTSAIGGVVSITTRSPTETFASAGAGGGSFGTWFGDAAGAVGAKRLRLYVGAHVLGSAGDFTYRSDNGTLFDPADDRTIRRQNNALRQVDAIARTAVPLRGRREIGAWVSIFRRDQGVPGFGAFETHKSDLATSRIVGSATYESRDDLGVGGRLRAQAYASITEQRFHDPLGEVAFGPTDSRDTTTNVGSTVRLARPVGSSWRLAGVVDGRYELFQPRDEASASLSGAPASRLSGAAGAEADAWVRRLRLDVIPSVRLEVSRDVVSGRDYFGKELAAMPAVERAIPIGRLGLIERPIDGVTFRANLGRYARLPATTELYGNTGFLIGNPALVPEKGLNADAGARVDVSRGGVGVALELAAFGALVDDLIQFQQTAQGRARATNIGHARILGIEASSTARAGRHLRFIGQGTFTDARDTSNVAANRTRQLPLRPRLRAYGRPEVRVLRIGGLFEVGAYADVDVTSGNYLDPANLVAVPSRVVFGAGGYAASATGRVRFVLSGQNLGDSHISDLAGFPLPGRAVFATLGWTTQSPPDAESAR